MLSCAEEIPWYDALRELKEIGNVRIHVCSSSLQAWNLELDDLILVNDIVGITEIVSTIEEAKITLFI